MEYCSSVDRGTVSFLPVVVRYGDIVFEGSGCIAVVSDDPLSSVVELRITKPGLCVVSSELEEGIDVLCTGEAEVFVWQGSVGKENTHIL